MSTLASHGRHEAPAARRITNAAELIADGKPVSFVELRAGIRDKQNRERWTAPKGPWIDAHASGFAGKFVSTGDQRFLANSIRSVTHFMPPETINADGDHRVLRRLVSVPAGKLVLGILGIHLNGFGSMSAEEAGAILSQSGRFSITSEHISFRGKDGFLGMAPYNWSSLLALEDAGFSPSAVPLDGSLAADELPAFLGTPRTDHITPEGTSDPFTLTFTRPHYSWPDLVSYWQTAEETAYLAMGLSQRDTRELSHHALRTAGSLALPAMPTDQPSPQAFR